MYQHGGDIYSKPDIKYDFSVSLNPLGMPQGVKKILQSNVRAYETYPDHDCRKLREKLAELENVPKDWISCANGASELIYDVVRAVMPKKAMVLVPAFSEYEKALAAVGAEVEYFPMPEEEGFTISSWNTLEKLIGVLDASYDMIFLCNPNNPSGNILKQDLIIEILRKCREYGIMVVLDECFLDFTDEPSMTGFSKEYSNLFLIKAFTKNYAMAGLRLGYAVCGDEMVLETVRKIRQYWNVSAVAQRAGLAALEEKEYLDKSRKYIQKERSYLTKELIKLKFNVVQSVANYILFREKDVKLDELLLERGILIRRCDDYRGMETGYYRIGIKKHSANQLLIRELRQIRAEECGFGKKEEHNG